MALDVLVDMLRNARFEAEEIEREKGVIVEEMNMYFDTPRDFIGGVYETPPLRRPAARPGHHRHQGDDPRRDAATPSSAISAAGTSRRAWCSASEAASATACSSARKSCSAILRTARPVSRRPPPPYANGRVLVHTKQSEQAHVVLGVRSLPLDHPDRYAIQLLATALGGGMSSRLFSEVRERRGLAYYVYGLNHSYTDAGTLYSQAGVDIDRIDDAVATIAGELRKIAAEPLPAEELEKARNFAKGRFVLQLESPQGLMLFGLRKEVLEAQASRSRRGARRDRRGDRRGCRRGRVAS